MRKILLFLVMVVTLTSAAIAQKRPIEGKVVDNEGKPVVGASILVKGNKKGVATGEDGTFKVGAQPGDILIISSIGFGKKQVKVGTKESLGDIYLESAGTDVAEVVVTGYGIKRKPKEIGYSTATVSGKELTQANVTNLENGLAGKVSGLQIITTDNGVNPTVKINLRGNRSILGNNEALLVVDGAIVPTSFISSINPDDIDNITVLKGSEGSAIYGSDGSNGVLIVTTKRDTKGKFQVKVKSSVQYESISIMPDLQTDYGSYGGEAGPYGGNGIVLGPYVDPLTGKAKYVPYENQSFGPRFDGSIVPLGVPKRFYKADGSYVDSQQYVPYTGLKNAKRDFWNTGLTTNNEISVANGDDKSAIYASFGNVVTQGIVPNDEYRKNSARVNGYKKYGAASVDFSVSYAQTNSNTVGAGFQSQSLYFSVINTPAHVNLKNYSNTSDPNSWGYADNYFNAYYANPWWQINNSRVYDRDEYLLGNIKFEIKATDWFRVGYRIGYTSHENIFKTTTNGIQYSAWEQSDPYGITTIGSSVKKVSPSENEGNVFTSKITGDFLLDFHKKIKDFDAKLTLGQSIQIDYLKYLSLGANALSFNNFYNISSIIGSPNYSETDFESHRQGLFADGTLGYKEYLFFHASYRIETTSILPTTNNSFPYGGADASLDLTELLPEIAKTTSINFFKFRVSYGVTGQVNLENATPFGAYNTQNYFSTAAGFPYGNVTGYALSTQNNNPNIKDERTTESEAGIEMEFYNNRINFQTAIYKSNTTNQTLTAGVSPSTGFTKSLINQGETQNIGSESDLKITPVLDTKAGFRWDIGMNFTYIFNKVVSLPANADISLGNASYAIVGKAFPSIKVYDWNRDPATGKVIVGPTGDPSRGSSLMNVGSAFNPYRYGFNTTLSYKAFTLSIVTEYRDGGKIFNAIGQDLDFSGISAHSTYGNRERFVFPNSVYLDGSGHYVDNKNRTISNVYNFWSGNINTVGTPYVTSASFWKLREISLSYKLPQKYLTVLRYVKAANVAMYGRNLLTIRPKENIWTDPEFNDNNTNQYGQNFNDAGYTTSNQNPPTKFVGFILNLTF